MDEKKQEFSHIRIEKETRDFLNQLKIYKRETYDEVITRMINHYLETKASKDNNSNVIIQ